MANWNEIKAEYVRGGITQKALAEKHGVSAGTLRHKAAAEGWRAQRQLQESGQITRAEISDRKTKQLELIDRALDIIADAFETDAYELRTDALRLGELIRHLCTLFSMQQAILDTAGDNQA